MYMKKLQLLSDVNFINRNQNHLNQNAFMVNRSANSYFRQQTPEATFIRSHTTED